MHKLNEKSFQSCCFYAAATFAYLQLWQQLSIIDGTMVHVAIWLTSLSPSSVSVVFQNLQSKLLCRGMIPLLIHAKIDNNIITIGEQFGLYLRLKPSTVCLVLLCTVTFDTKSCLFQLPVEMLYHKYLFITFLVNIIMVVIKL